MDWSRTKTVMIFALIIANLFVAYFMFFDNFKFSMEDSQLEDSINHILRNKKIEISPESDIKNIRMNKLYAHSMNMNLKKYVKNADTTQVFDRTFINNYVWVMGTDNSLECDYIAISDDLKHDIASILYHSQDAIKEYKRGETVQNYSEILETAQKFMEENLLSDFEKELFYVKKHGNLYQVYYFQKFENYLITEGYINIIIYHGKVMKYLQRWYDIEKSESEVIDTDDYSNTMYKLLRECADIRKKGNDKKIEIIDYDFGFSFYDEDHSLQVKYGELTPYYIFRTKDGDVIKVDAIKVD